MTAYKYRMPYGIPGDVSRQSLSTIVAKILGATAFTAYAQFAKVSSNTMIPIDAGDAAASISSVLIRPFPTQGPNASDPLGTSVPPTSGIGNFMERGFFIGKNNSGTPADRGQVYIRVANASSGKPIRGIEAALETAAASAAKAGGNTGNGAMTLDVTTPVLANAQPGVYTVRCITAAANSGTFEVKDPKGNALGQYVVGATFSDQIKFVIADGATDFIVGDGFDVTVTFNTIAVPNCYFSGLQDSSGNVEIQYNI